MTRPRAERRFLIVGADGLRPDLLDESLMPTYACLIAQGTRFSDYHAVYPTHTRVNITTLATGCHPGRHGIVANVMRVAATEDGIINTADHTHLQRLDQATYGRAVLVPTLGDLLHERGRRLAVASTSSGGAALLWARNHPYRLVNTNTAYGRPDLYALREKLGEPPPTDAPNRIPHLGYAARAVTDIFLDDPEIQVIVFWMSEPDFSQHYHGLGSPEAQAALRACDEALARVLAGLDRRGLRDQFDIFLMSDHGHSTVMSRRSLAEHLDRARRELGASAPEVVTASDFIYRMPDRPVPQARAVEPLVRWIQDQPWAGAILGGVTEVADLPGVLPLSAIWHSVATDRLPLLAVSAAWSSQPNEHGVPGTIAALTDQGALRSSHGSASPYDLHALLVAVGPDFREGEVTNLPAGAIDLVPTLVALLGFEHGCWIEGRVLWEAMTRPAGEPGAHRDERIEPEVPHPDGFQPAITLHRVGSSAYLHAVANGR